MSRILLGFGCIALIVPFILLSCGETTIEEPPVDNGSSNGSWEDQIISVIDEKWKKGYEEEKLSIYRTAFWEDNFEHRFILGVEVIETLYSFNEEEEYTQNVFDKFDEILMEITIDRNKYPEHASSSSTEAVVEADYKIQFIDEEETGASDPSPYKGYYAEGKITFTFLWKDDKKEWRIIKLEDKALSEEEIREKYKDPIEIIMIDNK